MDTASRELPKYKCHKEVWALKILAINFNNAHDPKSETDGTAQVIPDDDRYAAFTVDAAYLRKHKPEVGGYYVVYADGYKSYSPAKAFEEGYTRC